MGELDLDPVIHHFSHQHPLELLNLQQKIPNLVSCSGCKSGAWGHVYSCKTCNYFLHTSCSQMPRHITHPVDNHMLTLFPSPVYPEGLFSCDACGREGRGFCFHCNECQLDIHIHCAVMPLSVTHRAHHHPLTLSFLAPYKQNAFSCDICKVTGSNQWLYRCNSCSFDAHLNCISANSQMPRIGKCQKQYPADEFANGISVQRVAGIGYQHGGSQMLHDQVSPHVGTATGKGPLLMVQPARVNSFGKIITGKVVEGLVDGLAQQATQAMMQVILGGSPSSSGDSVLDVASTVNTILNN